MFQRVICPGVELRQFQLADAEAIFAAVDRNRARIRVWLPWVDQTESADDVRDFLSRTIEQAEANLGPQSGIWVDGAFAGSIGCHPINWPDRSCSIGYWLDAGHEGRGLITRGCAVMLDYLFGEAHLHRVEIRCGASNHRSCSVPQRLGFTREGVAREAQWVNDRWVDLVIWSLLAEEWRRNTAGQA